VSLKKPEIRRSDLPLPYRLLLKVPVFSIDSLPAVFQGLFWAVVIPTFIATDRLLTFYFAGCFPFPVNLILASTVPIAILIAAARVSLERAINFRNSIADDRTQKWDVTESIKEYKAMLSEKTKRKNAA
jgi:hypothetical protein